MKTREEYITLITSHAEKLQNTFGITSLRLFGSVARNQHHDGSDVDIYVGPAELISSHRQRGADVDPHSDDNDEKPPDFG